MKRCFHLLFAVSLLGITLGKPALSSAKQTDCWLLTQQNPNSPYSHSQIVLISPQGVNIATDDVKLFMVAPDYKMSMYNSSSREYYQAPAKQWLSKYGAHPFFADRQIHQKGISGKVASIPANQYFLMHGINEKAQKQREIWTTEAIDTNPNVKAALIHICGLPDGAVSGVPLRVTKFCLEDTKKSCSTPLRSSAFQCQRLHSWSRPDTRK